MTFVSGLGGAFLFSKDPERLAAWYTDHFAMKFEGSAEFGAFYLVFWGLDPDNPKRKLDTTFSIMRAKVDFPEREKGPEPTDMYGDQPFMLNLRVHDLDGLMKHLAAKGVHPLRREDEDYGAFAWIRDGDGNRVELYQPIYSE